MSLVELEYVLFVVSVVVLLCGSMVVGAVLISTSLILRAIREHTAALLDRALEGEKKKKKGK